MKIVSISHGVENVGVRGVHAYLDAAITTEEAVLCYRARGVGHRTASENGRPLTIGSKLIALERGVCICTVVVNPTNYGARKGTRY